MAQLCCKNIECFPAARGEVGNDDAKPACRGEPLFERHLIAPDRTMHLGERGEGWFPGRHAARCPVGQDRWHHATATRDGDACSNAPCAQASLRSRNESGAPSPQAIRAIGSS